MDYISFYELYDGLKFYKIPIQMAFENIATLIFFCGFSVFVISIAIIASYKEKISLVTIFLILLGSGFGSYIASNIYYEYLEKDYVLISEENDNKLQIIQKNLSKENLFELNTRIKMFGISFSNMSYDDKRNLKGNRLLVKDSHHFEKASLPTESEKADWENKIAFTADEFIFFMDSNRKTLINESIEKELLPKKEKEQKQEQEECITFCKLK